MRPDRQVVPQAVSHDRFLRSEGTMNGYNFTERVRKVLAMAREEAARLHHEYVGTEHILLGLIREGEGVAAAVLQNLNVDLEDIQTKIEETVKRGKAAQATGPDLPYTSRAKKVLELAMGEARELNHSYVGTEHLLLGLLREEKGIAAQALTDCGVNLDAARTETLRLLGTEMPQGGEAGATGGTHLWAQLCGAAFALGAIRLLVDGRPALLVGLALGAAAACRLPQVSRSSPLKLISRKARKKTIRAYVS